MTIISNKSNSHPLQSREWAEFRKTWGNEVLETEYGFITKHRIPFTGYSVGMFIKGPTPTQKMLVDLKALCKEHKLIFIKLEPNIGWELPLTKGQLSEKDKFTKLFTENNCVSGKTLFTPTTFQVDLSKSEEKLLESFTSKTRYNIRLALKKGVTISEDNSEGAFEKYIELTRETVTRQGFYAHSEKYHRLMWKYLHKIPMSKSQNPIARLMVAKYKKEIITSWIVFVYKSFLYYPYGASSEKYKEVMANNLMMWETIKYGKKMGLERFDLWGREPGKGFTKFKEGYNPQVVEFLGTWDLIASPFYWPYRVLEFFRWQILRTKSKFVKPTF